MMKYTLRLEHRKSTREACLNLKKHTCESPMLKGGIADEFSGRSGGLFSKSMFPG